MTDIDLSDPDSLMRLATSKNENEKLELLEVIEGHMDEIPNVGEYIEVLASDPSKDVREIVAFMLSNYFDRIENAGRILEKLCSDDSVYVRMRAATILVNNYQLIPNARELYLTLMSDPAQEVRDHLEDMLIRSFGSRDSFPDVFAQVPEPAPSEEYEEGEGEPAPSWGEKSEPPQIPAEEEVEQEEPEPDIIVLDEQTPPKEEKEEHEPETPEVSEIPDVNIVEEAPTGGVEEVISHVEGIEMEDSTRALAKRIGMLADALTEEEINMVLTSEFIEAMREEIERVEAKKRLFSKISL